MRDEKAVRGSILIVDDQPAVAEMLRDCLTADGYAVDRATSGGEAVMLASLARPDAVLLDLTLPDTPGDQVLARLLALDESMAVIIVSGTDDQEVARKLLKAGAIDYVRKPFPLDRLLTSVNAAVTLSRQRPRRGVVVPFNPDRRRRPDVVVAEAEVPATTAVAAEAVVIRRRGI